MEINRIFLSVFFFVIFFDLDYHPLVGLAMAQPQYKTDIEKLNIDFYYMWGWCEGTKCIPMVTEYNQVRKCVPILLLGNEPNAIPPYGSPQSPKYLSGIAKSINLLCPQTYLIVGNVSSDDWSPLGGWGDGYDWLKEYIIYDTKNAIGAHGYGQTAKYCIEKLSNIKRLIKRDLWVTEFSVLYNQETELPKLIKWLDRNTVGYSIYTNRQVVGAGYTLPYNLDLIDSNGNLTDYGKIFIKSTRR